MPVQNSLQRAEFERRMAQLKIDYEEFSKDSPGTLTVLAFSQLNFIEDYFKDDISKTESWKDSSLSRDEDNGIDSDMIAKLKEPTALIQMEKVKQQYDVS